MSSENAVYFDGVHLAAPSLNTLHAFAQGIGLKREWFQDKKDHPHYDVFGALIIKAYNNGAIRIRPATMVSKARGEQWEGWTR